MIARHLVLLACLLTAVPSGPAAAQIQVGVPGCADDVPLAASREAISFESRGRQIRAYLYSPRGEANGAGVVMLHGGAGFEPNSILFDAHALQLASRGYRVILPAYFDAASPDSTRRRVVSRAWRQAALDAAQELSIKPGMSADRIALWGYSRGAGVALDAVTLPDSPVRHAVLVAGAGAVDRSQAGQGRSVLLLHARRDEAVPVPATLRLAEDLRAAGAAVDVEGLDFDGHQYDLPTWCTVMDRTRAFLDLSRSESVGAAG